MSKVSAQTTDFVEFEAQFSSPTVGAVRTHHRTVGWVGAAIVSAALWVGIIAGIVELVHVVG